MKGVQEILEHLGYGETARDVGDWRLLSKVKAEAETLVLITPPEFDRDTWTAPEVPGAVPPDPDSSE